MAKFKPARGKAKRAVPQAGLPCVILVLLAMAGVVLFMVWVLKNSSAG